MIYRLVFKLARASEFRFCSCSLGMLVLQNPNFHEVPGERCRQWEALLWAGPTLYVSGHWGVRAVSLVTPIRMPKGRHPLSHSTDEEIKVQRGDVIYSGPYRKWPA